MGAKSNVERAQDDKLRLQTFCWVGTGFSEKELDQLYQTHKDRLCESLDCLETNMSLSLVVQPATKKKVDHWLPFGPVMEVYCADLSESSDHTCSSDGAECGIAPRFLRRLRNRPDKDAWCTTSAERIRQLYESQAKTASKSSKGFGWAVLSRVLEWAAACARVFTV